MQFALKRLNIPEAVSVPIDRQNTKSVKANTLFQWMRIREQIDRLCGLAKREIKFAPIN
jgi:hypothetical protein